MDQDIKNNKKVLWYINTVSSTLQEGIYNNDIYIYDLFLQFYCQRKYAVLLLKC